MAGGRPGVGGGCNGGGNFGGGVPGGGGEKFSGHKGIVPHAGSNTRRFLPLFNSVHSSGMMSTYDPKPQLGMAVSATPPWKNPAPVRVESSYLSSM